MFKNLHLCGIELCLKLFNLRVCQPRIVNSALEMRRVLSKNILGCGIQMIGKVPGEMADELEWLTRELKGVVRKVKNSAPGVDIRYGLVVYRDRGDEYVVRNYGFTDSQSKMVGWLRKQHASGGGDYPEAAAESLASGAALN